MRTPSRRILFLAAMLALAAPSAATVGPLPGTDAELVEAVRAKLERDRELASARLRVSAEAGLVRLQGIVPSLALRRKAVRRTASVRGVLAVSEALAIRPEVDDRRIELRVWSRLSPYVDLSRPHLAITVEHRRVLCRGWVGTIGRLVFLDKQLAQVPGVVDVDLTAVGVDALDKRPLVGERLRSAVFRLIRDPYQFRISGRVEVELEDGALVLHGRVPRLIDRMEAEQVVRLVSRGVELINRLEIDPRMGRLRTHRGSKAH